MENKYKIEFASATTKQQFFNMFTKSKEWQALLKKKEDYMHKGQFIQAIQMAKKIDDFVDQEFAKYARQAEKEAERINVNELGMPNDVKNELNKLYVVAFMTADILESVILDMNDAVKKFDKDLAVDIFDDFKEVNRVAQEKLRFFRKSEDVMNLPIWGTECDNMYEMMRNKAAKIIKEDIKEKLKTL